MQKIPKIIYQTWHTRDIPNPVREKTAAMMRLNPEYKHVLFTDNEMDAFVNTHFSDEIVECYNKLNIIVAKADFWRYLILYKNGGIYLDMDSLIVKSLDTLIKHDDDAIITAECNPYYVQWGLMFCKNHPILKKTIELVVDNIKNNRYPNDIHKMTGPTVFTDAVKSFNILHDTMINPWYLHKYIDERYLVDDIYNCRIFGQDYNEYLQFCFPNAKHLLYGKTKKHWTDEAKQKPLINS